jgi:hypothetical protein
LSRCADNSGNFEAMNGRLALGTMPNLYMKKRKRKMELQEM